eukprot:883202_1
MSSSQEDTTLFEYPVNGIYNLYPQTGPPKPVLVFRSATAVPSVDLFNEEKTIGTDRTARGVINVGYDKSDMTLDDMPLKDQLELLKKIFEEKPGKNNRYLNIISSNGTGISAGSLKNLYTKQGLDKIGKLLNPLVESLENFRRKTGALVAEDKRTGQPGFEESQRSKEMRLTALLNLNSVGE